MGRLDPTLIVPAQWDHIRVLLNDSYLMAGLFITGCAAFLAAHAIIPSLLATRDAPEGVGRLRPAFYAIAGAAVALSLFAMARMFQQAVAFQAQFFPRFGY